MTRAQKRQVRLILCCHFTASFAALGMPPYFGLILTQSFQVEATYLIGWFYIVPTICTALVSPWWGRLADYWGKKLSLLRAQLGLSVGFLLAGLATDQWWFFAALVIQGTFGGTLAASNAYLSQILQGEDLTKGLNLMQGSARAAMVAAPLLFGVLVDQVSPISLYVYLAFLPLVAALALMVTSYNRPNSSKPNYSKLKNAKHLLSHTGFMEKNNAAHRVSQLSRGPDLSVTTLYVMQFGFAFASVVSFPYFVPYAQTIIPNQSTALAGFLFSLPHLVYLLTIHTVGRWREGCDPVRGLALGFMLFAFSMWMQCFASSFWILMVGRLVMGASMTCCFVTLHQLMSAALTQKEKGLMDEGRQSGGRLFGNLDSASKWAGVCAGLVAGLFADGIALVAPLWVALISMGVFAGYLWWVCTTKKRFTYGIKTNIHENIDSIVHNKHQKETNVGAIKLR